MFQTPDFTYMYECYVNVQFYVLFFMFYAYTSSIVYSQKNKEKSYVIAREVCVGYSLDSQVCAGKTMKPLTVFSFKHKPKTTATNMTRTSKYSFKGYSTESPKKFSDDWFIKLNEAWHD